MLRSSATVLFSTQCIRVPQGAPRTANVESKPLKPCGVVAVVAEMIDVECASDCASDVDSGCDDDGHLS